MIVLIMDLSIKSMDIFFEPSRPRADWSGPTDVINVKPSVLINQKMKASP
jgi:hypothetical protein